MMATKEDISPEELKSLLPIQPAFKSEGDPSHKNAFSTGIKEF
jgi:hypothetical protein